MPSSYSHSQTQIAITQGGPGQLDLVLAATVGTGCLVYVTAIAISLSATGTITFQEGTGPTALSGAMDFPAAGGMVNIGNGTDAVLQTLTPGVKLGLTSTGGVAKGWMRYYIAPAGQG